MASNAFVLCKVRHNVSLSPCHAMEPRVGIEQDLTEQLMRYSEALQGVVLSFSDVQLAKPYGVIVNEMPFIHCKVLADALVFRPKEGMRLRGVVNKIGSSHVGMLFAGVFNGSVAEAELPKGYVHNYAQDCCGGSVSVHVAGGMIAIEATMRFDGVKTTSSKKAKKATHLNLAAGEPVTKPVKEKKVKKSKKEKKVKAVEEVEEVKPVKEKEKKSKKRKHEKPAEEEVVEEEEAPVEVQEEKPKKHKHKDKDVKKKKHKKSKHD
ncbi:unnamed protein product [Phytophthora lilii]|uniref:DNA-directed RNA polymerase I subunit RPA43 n=1 Tax=Phytophthora lilii TaxID=2077276 RepID=A0A9W6WPN3_9STRA|nr:unnamed protein product [Phytophthora lilii]